jgi:tetratricopeptide (TPR) repeat protein
MFAAALVAAACPCTTVFADQEDKGTIQNRVLSKEYAPDHGRDLGRQAQALSSSGKYAESEALFKEALAYWQEHPPASDLMVANCLNNLGLVYEKQDKFKEAIQAYEKSLSIQERNPENKVLLAMTLDNLAQVYRRQGTFDRAEALYKRALAVEDTVMSPDDQDHAITKFNLSLLYFQQGKYDLSEPLMTSSLAVLKKTLGETNPAYLNVYPYYLALLRKTSRAGEADKLEAQLKAKLANH